jgi:hypothetical protein
MGDGETMSTKYTVACHRCGKRATVAVRFAGCTRFMSKGTPNVSDPGAEFLVRHAEHCGLSAIAIHDEDTEPSEYQETVNVLGEVVSPIEPND